MIGASSRTESKSNRRALSTGNRVNKREPPDFECTGSVAKGWAVGVITTYMNDGRSRLFDLITCIDCKQVMKMREVTLTILGKSFFDIAVKNAGASKSYG